jgi:Zn-dependent protease with chaperone function
MLPDLSFLLGLLLGLGALEGSPVEPARAVFGTLAAVALGIWMIRQTVRRGLEALAESEGEPAIGEAGLRWCSLLALGAWMACLWFAGWGSFVGATIPRMAWLGRDALLLAPALALWGTAWAARAPLEAAVARARGAQPLPVPSARAAFLRGLGRNALALVPLFTILGLLEGVWVLGQLGVPGMALASRWIENMPLLGVAAMMGLLVVTLPLVPWIFARALRAQPLPPGRTRDVLESAAESIGLKYREILVWPTQNRIHNAMVVGVTGGSRRIIFTDALLRLLSEDETVAVFFHEAGHAKRRHLELYLVLFFALSLLAQSLHPLWVEMGIAPFWLVVLQLAALWFVLLGSVSRRLEREADLYGAEHAARDVPHATARLPGLGDLVPLGHAFMISALERLRAVLGSSRSHRHGTIEERVHFLASHATNPETREAWRRSRRALRLGIAGSLLGVLLLASVSLPGEVARARWRMAHADGMAAYDRAFALEHPPGVPAASLPVRSERSRAEWAAAYDHFDAAVRHGDGLERTVDRLQHLDALANRADTALHGLQDEERARRDFEAALAAANRLSGLSPRVALYRFQAHVELGRLALWRFAALPADAPGLVAALTEARAHLDAARALKGGGLRTGDEVLDEELSRWHAERLNLLSFSLDAHVAARDPGGSAGAEEARRRLGQLAQGSDPDSRWAELRDDARLELARLEAAKR